MKIAFVTDTHFGYRRFEEDALLQGKEAILSAAKEADLLILGGDNFDSPFPKMETLASVMQLLREALEIFHSRGIRGVPIFAIHGNHDRRAKGYVNPTELLARGGFLKNIHNKAEIYALGEEKVSVCGLGNIPDDFVHEAIKEAGCKPVENAFNVFVLHQSFQELEGAFSEKYLTFDDLPAGFDLYLCGHRHKPVLSGKVLNPGSTVVTQLRPEEAGQRGWLLYDTQLKKAEFKPIKTRPFVYKALEFSAAKPDEIKKKVEDEIKAIVLASPSAIVRISVKGTLANGFQPSDLHLPEFGENVFLDNAINFESLKEKIQQIKQSREQKKSPKELAMQILCQKLQGTAYSLGDPERLFSQLLDGTALPSIKERIEKKQQGV